MKIVIVNPNSTGSMTRKCHEAACKVANRDTEILSTNPVDSPASIQGYYDVAQSVVPMLKEIEKQPDADAYIIACFDDSGLDAARCLTDKPVLGIGEAAFHMASIISCRFSVVTTLRRSIPGIEANLKRYGLIERCAKVRASEIPVLDLESNNPATMQKLYKEIEAAISEDGAEAIVLGCAGMVDLLTELTEKFSIPFVDGVTSAVCLAEALVNSGMKTSKIGGYAR